MNNLLKFNECFPGSKYREVNKRCSDEDAELYRRSKAPKNANILSFDEIKMTDSRVGWIVPKEYIVVDIDNLRDARVVFKILNDLNVKFSYMTSKHGGHFIFKNSRNVQTISSGLKSSIGIQIDIRCNEKGYIILPYNDEDRMWGTITSDIDDIPYFLVPLKQLKPKEDFFSLESGDGRNSKLFSYFMCLKDYASELSLDEKITSVKLINKYLFKEPMSESELESTILRPENLVKVEKEEKKQYCLEEALARKIVLDKHLITCNGICYRYNDKYYEFVYDNELERIIHEEYDSKLKESKRKEVISFIKLKSYVDPRNLNSAWNKIVVKNGILNITEMKLYPHNPDEKNTIYVNQNYIENAGYSAIIDNFLNQISGFEEDKKQLLLEIVGYCFIRKNIFEKFFICVGEGQTGKSTFLNLITKLIGTDNVTYLELKDLDTNFMTINLFGKLVNIGDDISFKGALNSNILKKVVSGQEIMAQQKYKEAISFSNFSKLIFTSNKMPTFLDKTTGLYRRLCIVDINHRIETPDRFFLDKITESDLEYLLFESIKAIRKAIQRNNLTEPASAVKSLRRFKVSQSSVLLFLEDNGYNGISLDRRVYSEVYFEYRQYCLDSGYKPVTKLNFKRDVCEELKMDCINTTAGSERQAWRFVK